MSYLKKIFGNNLTYYINKNNFTKKEIAEKLKISSTNVSYWCRGEQYPRPEIIEKLSEIFNIPVENLITDTSTNKQINNNNITNSNNFNISQYNNVVNELKEENKRLKEENKELKNNSNNLSELESELLKIYNTLDFKDKIELLQFSLRMKNNK